MKRIIIVAIVAVILSMSVMTAYKIHNINHQKQVAGWKDEATARAVEAMLQQIINDGRKKRHSFGFALEYFQLMGAPKCYKVVSDFIGNYDDIESLEVKVAIADRLVEIAISGKEGIWPLPYTTNVDSRAAYFFIIQLRQYEEGRINFDPLAAD